MIDVWKGIVVMMIIALAMGIIWSMTIFIVKVWEHINTPTEKTTIRFDKKGNLTSITTDKKSDEIIDIDSETRKGKWAL